MCELLGMSANVPTDIVFSFTGLMQRGGKTGPHKDGWGIAFYEGRGLRLFQDPVASCESEVAKMVQRYLIKSEVVIGHIRHANVGKVSWSIPTPLSVNSGGSTGASHTMGSFRISSQARAYIARSATLIASAPSATC